MSASDAHNRSGESHPVTMAALADPANPSRVRTLMTIHHHGNDAPMEIMVARILRNICIESTSSPHPTSPERQATGVLLGPSLALRTGFEFKQSAASPWPCCFAGGPTDP